MKYLPIVLLAASATAKPDLFVRDTTCAAQVCIDAGKYLDNKCLQQNVNVLECICDLSGDEYWNQLSKCVQECGESGTDSSPASLRKVVCDAADSYSSYAEQFSSQINASPSSRRFSSQATTGSSTRNAGAVLGAGSLFSLVLLSLL
ncbi:uncharacterized protein LODBEIA_P10890 [Lodderomyces beijingensis]|uniref:Extracellular membrane protein CFEM domain-containing protein n=1 Tax=Lodderomyces beijingensis TaxID=1775926 RepID=A0ABP0ZFC2_9ASCO